MAIIIINPVDMAGVNDAGVNNAGVNDAGVNDDEGEEQKRFLCNKSFTFRHESGSPSFRTVTGHTYRIVCKMEIMHATAARAMQEMEARGIRFVDTDEHTTLRKFPFGACQRRGTRGERGTGQRTAGTGGTGGGEAGHGHGAGDDDSESESDSCGAEEEKGAVDKRLRLQASSPRRNMECFVLLASDEGSAHPSYGDLFACHASFLEQDGVCVV